MSNDAGRRELRRVPPRIKIPEIIGVEISRIPFEAPKLRHFESSLSRYDQAIAFRVETSDPISTSENVTLVLYVGNTILTEVTQLEETVYQFLAFEEERLEPSASITLAYPGTPAEARPEARFKYEPPDKDGLAPETVE